MTKEEIDKSGMYHAMANLRAKGFTCSQCPGSTDIEATLRSKKLLMQVRTAQFPTPPNRLGFEEEHGLIARANAKSREPVFAQVQIDHFGAQYGEIIWSRLT